MNKFIKFLSDYSAAILAFGGILAILAVTGFDLNIVAFYRGLTIENKILFASGLNILFSLLLFSINSSKKK